MLRMDQTFYGLVSGLFNQHYKRFVFDKSLTFMARVGKTCRPAASQSKQVNVLPVFLY